LRLSRTREGGRVETAAPAEPPVEVVVRYSRENILMSGWGIGQERHLAGRPAMVRVPHGQGAAVLFAFQPQFRSQPRGTYKLIFNALFGATVP
jgi:hypothetical protein